MKKDVLYDISDENYLSIMDVFAIIARYRYLVIIITMLSILAAGGYLYMKKPVYVATGQVLVEPHSRSVLEKENITSFERQLINNSYVERIKGRSIADSVIVQTSAYIRLNIPEHARHAILQLDSDLPEIYRKYTFAAMSGMGNEFDYKVLLDDEQPVGYGSFNEVFVTDDFSIILDTIDLKTNGFSIEVFPLKQTRASVLQSLSVANITDTNIIKVSFRSHSPSFAQEITNTYIRGIIDQDLTEKRKESRAKIQFLETQYEKHMNQLKTIENRYIDTRVAAGMVAIDKQTNQLISLLSYLEEKRIEYEINLQEAISINNKSIEILTGDPDQPSYQNIASSPFVRDNIVIQDLYSKISELQVENARLSAEYSTNHPLVKQNEAELETARKQLEAAVDETVMNATSGVDPILRPVVEKQLLNRINIDVYQGLLDHIKSEISALESRLKELPQAEMDEAEYARVIRTNEEVSSLLLTRLEEARIMEASTISDLQVIDMAETPLKPVSSSKLFILAFAVLGGFVMSGALIWIFELLNTSFSSIESIEHSLGTSVIGTLPRFGSNNKRSVIVGTSKNDDMMKKQAYELFDRIMMNLMISDDFGKEPVLVVSSAIPMEGKSFICANLAAAFSHAGQKKVLIIDCDFRNPVQHQIFSVPNHYGIVDVLKKQEIKGIVKTNIANLYVLPAGRIQDINTSRLINNPACFEVINTLKTHFNLIIIDTPPLNAYPDAMVLAKQFQKFLLIMNSETNSNYVLYAHKVIKKTDAQVLGVVVNRIKKDHMKNFSYGYHYKY